MDKTGSFFMSKTYRYLTRPLRMSIFFLFSYLIGYYAGALVHDMSSKAVTASSDGNWGLSFQEDGKPPIANGTKIEKLAIRTNRNVTVRRSFAGPAPETPLR